MKKKFFGYIRPELCQILLDISEFGLKHDKTEEPGLSVGPRFYMKYGSEIWFMLFEPETKGGGVLGFQDSTKLRPDSDFDDEDEDAAKVEKDREVAENFDKLVDEVSRFGILRVLTSNSLAGWEV